jgi:hypothetical protein
MPVASAPKSKASPDQQPFGASETRGNSQLIAKIYTSNNPIEVIDAIANMKTTAKALLHDPAPAAKVETFRILTSLKGALTRTGRTDRETRKAALEALVQLSDHNLTAIDGLNLSKLDLIGINLSRTDLRGMDISHSFILYSDFRWSNLSAANLSQSLIHNLRIAGAVVDGLDLSGTDWFNIVDLSDHQFSS